MGVLVTPPGKQVHELILRSEGFEERIFLRAGTRASFIHENVSRLGHAHRFSGALKQQHTNLVLQVN
jgi:hypothetical protein